MFEILGHLPYNVIWQQNLSHNIEKIDLWTNVSSNDSDQHLHLNRLIRGFTSLRKHAYSNTLKISTPKTGSFQIKKSDIFQISTQNIDCGTR